MSDKVKFLVDWDIIDAEDEQVTTNALFEYEDNTIKHREILDFAIKESIEITKAIKLGEQSKRRWRNFILMFLVVLLILTLASIGVTIWLYVCRDIELPTVFLAGIFSTFVAQIVSLLALFIKFITSTETLKMHKIVTHKLLDYLVTHQSKK